jgi:hypothetical protein
VQQVVGGAREVVHATERVYKVPRGTLEIDVRDDQGQRVPARIAVLASDLRAYAPDTHGCTRTTDSIGACRLQKHITFHCAPPCSVTLPTGDAQVSVRLRVPLRAVAADCADQDKRLDQREREARA